MKAKFTLVVLFFIAFFQTSFSQVIPRDIVDRVNRSEYIFEGEVIATNPYWNARHDYIYTSVTIETRRLFKGDLTCGTVELILLGGRVGDFFLELSHNLVLSIGQKGIFLCQNTRSERSSYDFYPETNSQVLQPTDNEQGFIKFNSDGINPDVVDYWQFHLDSVAQAYDMMELYTQLQYIDCTPIPSPEEVLALDTNLYITFLNEQVTFFSGSKYFEFDIALSDSINFIHFVNGGIKLKFDTVTFDSYIDSMGGILTSTGTLFQDTNTYVRPNTTDVSLHPDEVFVNFHIKNPNSNPYLNYIDLPQTPIQAAHVRMKIKDCNQLSTIIATPVWTSSVMTYAFQNNFPNPHGSYDTIYISNNIDFNGCGSSPLHYISSILPHHVRAGIGDTVTITGLGFGAIRGAGNVFLKNADLGGIPYLHLDSVDYLANGWTDTIIKFIVPSIVDSSNLNAQDACPGSGFVKIKLNTGDSINDLTDFLYIDWGIRNAKYGTNKHLIHLTPHDSCGQYGAFLFRPNFTMTNYPERITCLSEALRQWRCLTQVNFRLGTDTLILNDSVAKKNSISEVIVGYCRESSTIAFTSTWGFWGGTPCNSIVSSEMDITFNRDLDLEFFADTNRLDSVPNGKIDMYTTFLHEIGHAHTLTHVNDPNDIMWFQQLPYGLLPSERKIFVDDSPNAVEAGQYSVYMSKTLDTSLCSPIQHMSLGTSFCVGVVGFIGISEINNAEIGLNIYPNPATNKINVSFELVKPSEVTISIFDISGRKVYNEEKLFSSNLINKELSIESFPSGFYMIKIKINQAEYVGKVIKQ